MLEGPFFLGIGFLISGLLFIFLVWALLRIVPRVRPPAPISNQTQNPDIISHQDAILVVEVGGRIREINDSARSLFDLSLGETPNLQRMSNKVRPGESFLEICAMEGQTLLSVNGRQVDAISYRLSEASPAMIIALRRKESHDSPVATGAEYVSGIALKSITEFGEDLSASPDINSIAAAILVNVERLVPSDFCELKVWDETTQSSSAYHFDGHPGTERILKCEKTSLFGEYSSLLSTNRKELFIPDTHAPGAERYDTVHNRIPPMGSYMGVRLVAQNQYVGTLEIGVVTVNSLGIADLRVLQMIAGQVALALRSANLYSIQQRWNNQLEGLTNLSQAMTGSAPEMRELFSRIVNGIAPLFNVEILGFLLFDEQRRMLEGQTPFIGMPENIVDVYRVSVRQDSPLDVNIQSKKPISTSNAAQDEAWAEMGLQDMALASSIRDTHLFPLISNNRFWGYLQISNRRKDGTSNFQEEPRLVNIVTSQVAAVIENAILRSQAYQRNQRVESMRRITSLVSSPAGMDQMLQSVLNEVAQLFRADVGSIFLLDESAGVMRAHVPSAFGVPVELQDSLANLNVKPAGFRLTVAGSQRSFVSGNLNQDRRVLPLYRSIVRKLNLASGIVVPMVVQGRGIGEMMLGALKQDFFIKEDLPIIATIAGQLAVAIESARRISENDPTLRRRSDFLAVMNRVARELNSTFDLKDLIRFVYDECLAVSGAKCGAVLLYEEEKNGIETPEVMFRLGHSLAETLMGGELSRRSAEPRLITDFSATQIHPGVLSALAVPICYQDENVGLIELHSSTVDGFDDISIEMVRNIGVQAALAIGNALRYLEQQGRTELYRRRADTLMQLFETSKNLRIDETLVSSLGSIAQGIQKATPFNVVLVSLYDPSTDLLKRTVAAGIDEATFARMQLHQQHWSSVSQLMTSDFEIGNLYFIPVDKAPIIPADIQFLTILSAPEQKPNAWDPDDILMLPIFDNNQTPLGLISVDAPRDGLRPDRIALETLEVFAAQAALTITSGLNIQNFKSQIEYLDTEVKRQKKLVDYSQRSLPMMLHKDLEQMMMLSQVIQRARHIRASLQVTEAISQQLDSSAALQLLGQQVLTSFNMAVVIVARETIDGPRIMHIAGILPRGVNPESSFGQRNPLRTCLQKGEVIISSNLDDDENWHDTPFLSTLHAKSFICLPIVINGKPIAAVLATDTAVMPEITAEDYLVYTQASKQISVILQNISLLNETRQRLQEVNLLLDFSRHLSGLNPNEIFKSLLESALRVVNPAHAGVVFIWEPNDEILIPLSASNYADDASVMQISYRIGEGILGRVFTDKQPRRIDEINFVADYNLSPENLLRYRKATGGRLPVSSMVVPIMTSDRYLGALVLDNFNTPAAFHAEDEAILLSLTQQVALSLENVRLMQTTQERTGQLQALNVVAAALTSSLKLDELVASLLDRMAAVIPYDTAILWLRQENQMVVMDARGFEDNAQRIGLTVAVDESVLLHEMTRTGQAIVVNDVRADHRFTSLLQPHYLSWMGVPLIAKDQVIGVLAVEKKEIHFYSTELMQLVATLASQAAIAIDNASLFEESVRRAAELDERSQRLALLNKFSADLGGSLSAEQVLSLTGTQLIVALRVDRAMLFFFDHSRRDYLLSVLPDEAGRPNLYRGLPSSAVLNHLRESQTVYAVEEVRLDPNLASLTDLLDDATSALFLPIPSGDKLYAMALLSKMPRRFMATEIELARTIGNQAAIALENADLYQSTLATAERLAILNQVSHAIGSSLNAEDIYLAAHQAAGKLMPLDAFVVALVDESSREIDGVYVVDAGQRIRGVRLPYGQGLSGQVIATGKSILTLQAVEAEARGGVTFGEKGTPHSIVAVPMISGGRVIGSLSAQSYQFNAYTDDDEQILSTLANQVTVAILNARLLTETQKMAATLEQRVVERTAQLEHEHHNTVTLLRILTEVTSSLDLDRALNRTLALLNDAIGAEQGTIMMLHASDNKLYYRAGYGVLSGTDENVPASFDTQTVLNMGEGLAGWVVQNRKPAFVNDLRRDSRWVPPPGAQVHRSALAVPLVVAEDVIGAIMVFHHTTGYFGEESLEMVKAIGSQVAIAINNAQLYELIRDQAERLGAMLRQQQMEASRQTAILEAMADGVLVTNASNLITFVNVSVKNILDVNENQLQGQPLEHFAGLFGQAARTWIQTVKQWSESSNSQVFEIGEMYAEQISLDTGRVVLVHLAPVVWRQEFFGTVSIFRDITHEVEVDRMKSEFVATVSHELRTPMTSIRGYVDLLKMGAAGMLNENQIHFMDIISSNTERLNILVNDLLDVSKFDSDRITLSMHLVNLQEVADEVISELQDRSQKENKHLDVKLDYESHLPKVMADPERIRQIIGNLVDNAYNYTPADGEIKVVLRKVNGSVQVDVKDSGIGIALDQHERIFERFFRGENPMVLATPGTGLGLPIVKQLVEMHHGRIWMYSTGIPGQGSTFSFTLPAHEKEE